MMFAIGFIGGILIVLALFIFATWRNRDIHKVIERVEDTVGEQGGFLEPMDTNKRVRKEVTSMLDQK